MAWRKLNQDNLSYHCDRLAALRADTSPRWGGMDASAMTCHLRATVEMSLGELEVKRLTPPIIGKPIGFLSIYVFTLWPKGKPGTKPPVPELFPAPEHPFEQERERLVSVYRRFAARAAADPEMRTIHLLMGRTSLSRWCRIHGLHSRHHYRQFGLV